MSKYIIDNNSATYTNGYITIKLSIEALREDAYGMYNGDGYIEESNTYDFEEIGCSIIAMNKKYYYYSDSSRYSTITYPLPDMREFFEEVIKRIEPINNKKMYISRSAIFIGASKTGKSSVARYIPYIVSRTHYVLFFAKLFIWNCRTK